LQRGKMAANAKEAAEVARAIRAANPKAELILKAQIHAGGRGKGTFDNGFKGGVKICDTVEQVRGFTQLHDVPPGARVCAGRSVETDA
jgi:succinyl-CoA synthetase beta subunit